MKDKRDVFEQYTDLLDTSDDPSWIHFVQTLESVHKAATPPASLVQEWRPSTQMMSLAPMQHKSVPSMIHQFLSVLKQSLSHQWLVLRKQVGIIHTSIWIVTALVMLLVGCGFLLLSTPLFPGFKLVSYTDAEWLLGIAASTASCVGISYIYGQENDEGLELTFSTPTSIRMVLLCRIALVISYNVVLALLVSLALVFAYGGGIGEVIQTWLGPLLFFSSISLTLSLMVSSLFAVFASLLFEVALTFVTNLERGIPALHFVRTNILQTSPMIVILSLLILLGVMLYMPQHMEKSC